ncbi:UvrB/UvrC motif-containing protein, partial [Polaribacter sp.]|nr:UvrB/UvrC motif-containing protein [Polaribacter sp.]
GVNLNVDEEFDLYEENDSEEDEIELEAILPEKESTFSRSSLKELHQQLEKAVDNENYELAAKIRDEISKR